MDQNKTNKNRRFQLFLIFLPLVIALVLLGLNGNLFKINTVIIVLFYTTCMLPIIYLKILDWSFRLENEKLYLNHVFKKTKIVSVKDVFVSKVPYVSDMLKIYRLSLKNERVLVDFSGFSFNSLKKKYELDMLFENTDKVCFDDFFEIVSN